MSTFRSDPKAALAAYREQGFHLEPEMLSVEECEALINAGACLPPTREGVVAPVMHPHRYGPIFLQALRKPEIVHVLELLVGGRVSGLQTQYFFCPPGTPGFSMHQDNFYAGAAPEVFASAWTALEDVTPENGGLILWPGTHREPVLPVREVANRPLSASQDPNANWRETVMPPGYAPLSVSVPRGAVVFLHGQLVHSSHDNASQKRWRRALLMTYIRTGEHFRPGLSSGRAEVELYP